MKLNLGCGNDRRDGYVNVDIRPDAPADLHEDVANLASVHDEQAEGVLALDILEHFPTTETESVLAEWHRVLAPGGALVVRVPNMTALAHALIAGSPDPALIIRNIYGGHRWGPGGCYDTHHTGWTPAMLESLLDRAGFTVRSNDQALNMVVRAVKR